IGLIRADNARIAEAEQRQLAQTNERNALFATEAEKRQAAITQAVNEFLQTDLLRQASPREQAEHRVEIKRDLTVREALDRAAARVSDRFKQEPLIEAAICQAIGEAYLGIGENPLAVPQLERARTVRKVELGPEHPDTLSSMHSLSRAYTELGDRAEGVRLL